MRIKGIFQAILTAHEIEQLVKQKRGVAVDFKVNNPFTKSVETLSITFHGIKNHGLVVGHTEKGETVLIKLGDADERRLKHPSVILSMREAPQSVGQSANSNNDTPKRR